MFSEEEELKNLKRLKKILKNAKCNGEDNSIELTDGKKSYCVYFNDKNDYHSVFIGFSQNGSMIDLEHPEDPLHGELKIRYIPHF